MQVVANMFEVSAKQVRDIWERKLAFSVTGTQFTCFTSTRAQILTHRHMGAQARSFPSQVKKKKLTFLALLVQQYVLF
jgi:hypothetical protein